MSVNRVLGRLSQATQIALKRLCASGMVVSDVTAQISDRLKSPITFLASKLLFFVVDFGDVRLQACLANGLPANWAKNFLKNSLFVFHVPLLLGSHSCFDVNHQSMLFEQLHRAEQREAFITVEFILIGMHSVGVLDQKNLLAECTGAELARNDHSRLNLMIFHKMWFQKRFVFDLKTA